MNDRLEIASRFANGFLSNPNYIDYISRESKKNNCKDDETIAALSLLYADALIALEANTHKYGTGEFGMTENELERRLMMHGELVKGMYFSAGHAQAIEQMKRVSEQMKSEGNFSNTPESSDGSFRPFWDVETCEEFEKRLLTLKPELE